MKTVCPPEIAEIVAEILGFGIVRIRLRAWSSLPDRCAVEADHLHKLPSLLTDFSVRKLKYYWDVQRESYIKQTPSIELAMFEPLWERLRPHLELIESADSAGSTGPC